MADHGAVAWLWVPIVLAAAAAQTVRNAVQREVTKTAGVGPATFIRFFFGLPFALAALAAVAAITDRALPAPDTAFVGWVTLGAVTQVLATAFFVGAMAERSFVVAVVFTKTEVLQVGLYAFLFLGEAVAPAAIVAMGLATAGVVLLSAPGTRAGGDAWFSRGAMLGLASGACLALCAVGYRGAMLALPAGPPWMQGLYGLAWAQAIQSALVGAWLAARDRPGLGKVMAGWRVSIVAGLAGALASMGWFTAFAMRGAVDVRVAGLVEVLFSYAVSRRLFREAMTRVEAGGIVLLVSGVVVVSLAG